MKMEMEVLIYLITITLLVVDTSFVIFKKRKNIIFRSLIQRFYPYNINFSNDKRNKWKRRDMKA